MSQLRASTLDPQKQIVTVRCPGCGQIQFMMEPNAKIYIERLCRCKTMVIVDGPNIRTATFDRAVKSA